MSSWYLEDVAQTDNGELGVTIPSEQERSHQKAGDLVRLHFVPRTEAEHRGEALWVRVEERTEVDGYVYYRGHVSSRPESISDLSEGDEVFFEPCHVAQTLVSAGHPSWLPVGEKNALVSARALESQRFVRWAYREPPDDAGDSGWRMFAGDESDEYVDDPANIRVCNIYWLLERDPSVYQLFGNEVGSAFERDSQDDPWRKVEDWQAEQP